MAGTIWFVGVTTLVLLETPFRAASVYIGADYEAVTWRELSAATGQSEEALQKIQRKGEDCRKENPLDDFSSEKWTSSGCRDNSTAWSTGVEQTQAARDRKVRSRQQEGALAVVIVGIGFPLSVLAIGHALAWAYKGLYSAKVPDE